MSRSLPALVLAGALALGSALVAAPAQAASDDVTYYSVPFSGDLYVTSEYEDYRFPVTASFDDWAADGFPKPVPASITYRAFTWADEIYSDIQTDPGAVSTHELTFPEWRAAGSPAPTTNGLPADSGVYKFGYSDELFVAILTDGRDVPVNHKLTFTEFAHLGYPSVVIRDGGFRKLSWLPAIVGATVPTYEIEAIDLWTWDYWGRPTPQIVKSFDGDRFCQKPGSADISYVGIAAPQGVKLSFGQWREAGSPAPARC
jgi:hypothetical protein